MKIDDRLIEHVADPYCGGRTARGRGEGSL